ncbi:MAG: hypothetical protein ACREMP_00320 [Candidatus Tyrphobacter sp.]
MTPLRKLLIATALGVVLALASAPATGAIEADPQVLYAQMKAAYAKAAANGWDYFDQLYYLTTIFDTGRAYSLQRPNDAAYGEVATLAVQIGAAMHWNPLTNHDAATWYVREASIWVQKNSTDPALLADAQQLLVRANAQDGSREALAALADEDANALARTYPHDVQADILPLEADWDAWKLTNDPAWRSKAFQRAAQPSFPIADLSYLYAGAFVDQAQRAIANVPGFTTADRSNAAIVVERLTRIGKLEVIARMSVVPFSVYMTTLAPADEYFGRLRMSVIGIENELKRINLMLNYGWGDRESAIAVSVANSVDDMHRIYPRDRDMTKLLYECIETLDRMTTPQTQRAAKHLRGILTVEYENSPQAAQLLGDAPGS